MRRKQSKDCALYPLRFHPAYKDYPWGGRRIIQRYCRREPPGVYAESWEVSDHPDGISIVANGALKGTPFHEIMARFGQAIMGPRHAPSPFPLLIKILDARDTLSVQVHPTEPAALRWGGEPKTESWYFLDAPAGAGVYAGWEPGVSRSKVERALKQGGIEKLLRWVPVLPGDTVFMPAGRVHAIGAGCLILEVQQRANTTYRLYDWNRRDSKGRLRDLHVEEALRSVRWQDRSPVKLTPRKRPCAGSGLTREELVNCPHFRVERVRAAKGSVAFASSRLMTCAIVFGVQGEWTLGSGEHTEKIRAGSTCLVPYCLRSYTLTSVRAPAEAIIITPARAR